MPLLVAGVATTLLVLTIVNILPSLITTHPTAAEYEQHRESWKMRLATAILPMLSVADTASATWDFKRVSSACGDALSKLKTIQDEMEREVPPPDYQQGHEQMRSSLMRMEPALEACERGDFTKLTDLHPGATR